MNTQNRPIVQQQLCKLDALYYAVPLAIYEAALQTAVMQVQQTFPGFTIAYAEISTVGSEREAHGGMRHVLLPQQGESPLPEPDAYSATARARRSKARRNRQSKRHGQGSD